MSGRRPTRLIVRTSTIEGNARSIRNRLSPETRLMAVVKANAYGHGAIASALAARRGGATHLGVATVSEAAELRDAGIDLPVLVLGSSDPSEGPTAAELDVAIGVGDLTQLSALVSTLESAALDRPLAVHLKIDTGMRRFGVAPAEAVLAASRLVEHPAVRLEGVYSHFAEADDPSSPRSDVQFALFRETLRSILAAGIEPGITHISNSAGLLRNRSFDLGMVRAGICLYGIEPSAQVPLFDGMGPALEWRASIQHIVELSPGDRTGYGGTYVASDHERLALLPVGYADGYPRHLSNTGWAGFRGHRLPVRGRVSMDQCVVGVPAGVGAQVGDEVVLIGPPDSGAPSACQLAHCIDTIGYEIVARLSPRVPIDYLEQSPLIGADASTQSQHPRERTGAV